MESARDRLRRLLEAGEVSEDEARALLDELARRRASSGEHPMSWWIRRTAWVPWLMERARVRGEWRRLGG